MRTAMRRVLVLCPSTHERADAIGAITESDVKERGIIVGYVKSVKVDSGSGACVKETLTCVSVTLAINPSRAKIIPNNVSAQILPKTLFGEPEFAGTPERGAP